MIIGVIGSCAMNLWLDPENTRNPQDLDIVATYEDIQAFVEAIKADGAKVLAQYPISSGKKVFIKTDRGIVEAEVAWPGSSAEALLELIMSETGTGSYAYGVTLCAPPLDLLYMLKMSHRYLKNSPHFLKTMQDIQMLRGLGCKIRPEHEEFYKERMKWTYDYKHPKLNQSKGDFFTDDVPYIYDHDSIHDAVKMLNYPAYMYFKPADSDVAVSREMFEKLNEQVKLYSVLEEVYVLALERSQIPYPDTDKKRSFDMAHMKVCTSITSGWWREFAWENYDKVQAMYHESYVFTFWAAVHYGKVKLHTQPTQGEF
jgi:hypothetical protein